MSYEQVYSDFEIDQFAIKVAGANDFVRDDCVGSLEEDLEAITVTKKCRGIVKKSRTRGSGSGTLNISMHVKKSLADAISGMYSTGLTAGVAGYGAVSVHPEFIAVARVKDEDGVIKYKGYPKCTLTKRPTITIENGAEEVAEVEMEIALAADEYNLCMYEAIASELTGSQLTAENWMTTFSSTLAQD